MLIIGSLQVLVRNMKDYLTLYLDIKKVKEQLIVRNYMNADEHDRLSNTTLRNKLK